MDATGSVVNKSEGFDLTLAEITLLCEARLPLRPGAVEFGVGTPGTTVELWANGEVVGTAVVAEDGTWALPANHAGDVISLRALGADGTLLGEAESVSATVAAEAAGSRRRNYAAEIVPPTFNSPEGGGRRNGVSSGAGTPGSEVAVVVNGEVVGMAAAEGLHPNAAPTPRCLLVGQLSLAAGGGRVGNGRCHRAGHVHSG